MSKSIADDDEQNVHWNFAGQSYEDQQSLVYQPAVDGYKGHY